MTSGTLDTTQTRSGSAAQAVWPAALAVFLAGVGWFMIGTAGLPLIDRDEPMIAEVARQMVHRGQWLTPHLPAWEYKSIFKPPMAMWLIGLSFKTFGASEWSARLPSVICSALATTILFAGAHRRWGRTAGLVAAACMALPLLPAVTGRMVLTDPLLVLLATAILLCLERLLCAGESEPDAMLLRRCRSMPPATRRGPQSCGPGSTTGDQGRAPANEQETRMAHQDPRRRAWSWCQPVLWLALGLSFLVKGPALLVFLGPTLVLTADQKAWRAYAVFLVGMLLIVLPAYVPLPPSLGLTLRILGGLIVLACVVRWLVPVLRLPIGLTWGAPVALAAGGWWFACIACTSTAHHQSLERYVGFEVLARIIQPIESHWGPPGYYVLVALVGLLPLSLLLPNLLTWSIRAQRLDPTVRLLLAWIAGSWLLWEIVVTKLPHYILPAVPALALLAARWYCQQEPRRNILRIAGLWAIVLLTILAAAGNSRACRANLSHRAADAAMTLAAPGEAFYVYGYTEPGVFFYLPADRYQRVADRPSLEKLQSLQEPFVLIVGSKQQRQVTDLFGRQVTASRTADGYNAAKASWQSVYVYRIEPARTGRTGYNAPAGPK